MRDMLLSNKQYRCMYKGTKNSLIIIKSWRIADYNKNYKDPLYLPHVYQRSNFNLNHLEEKKIVKYEKLLFLL